MSAWSLVYDAFDPDHETLRESLCTLGNGYFATRGAAQEADADGVHYPGTYLAGGYNRLRSEIAGHVVENEDLVNLPNWLPLSFRIDGGPWFGIETVEVLSYRQELDLRQGMLARTVRFRDEAGRETIFASRRFVHMRTPHLAAIEMTLAAQNWTGEVEFRSALDGNVVNGGVRRYRALNNKHLEVIEADQVDDETIALKVRTNQSRLEVAVAARTRVLSNGQGGTIPRRAFRHDGYIAQLFSCVLAAGQPLTLEKVIAFHTSRDQATSECGLEARKTIARAGTFELLGADHALAWAQLWRRFDIGISDVDYPEAERSLRILRLHIFHLLQTASPNTIDLDVGVPARGLHGEAYRGHIFWDELFIFPFLNLRVPEITRALLKYRFRRLGEARAAARQAGYRGAMYPWQSGSDGREESQVVHLNPQSGRWVADHSHLQRHINAAIAHNVWQYFEVTRDLEFLSYFGAEMIIDIARFWASIATYNSDLERYEILGVVGPDEYHTAYPDRNEPGLDNNAYTNVMAVWVLERALAMMNVLPTDRRAELWEALKLSEDQLDLWRDITRKMRVPFHDGVISQFEGYERLEEFDWTRYRKKYRDIHRLDRILEAEGDTPNRYKISKQADVLMLFYLFSAEELAELFRRLGYGFEPETIPRTIDYYARRTSHGSTLSRVVHSWVLARSDRARSWKLFAESLESDVSDIQGGTTPEGIHLGAMAGTVDLIQRGYTGIEVRGDVLRLNPCLPDELGRLHLDIRYRGRPLGLDISSNALTIRAGGCIGDHIKVAVGDRVEPLRANESLTFAL